MITLGTPEAGAPSSDTTQAQDVAAAAAVAATEAPAPAPEPEAGGEPSGEEAGGLQIIGFADERVPTDEELRGEATGDQPPAAEAKTEPEKPGTEKPAGSSPPEGEKGKDQAAEGEKAKGQEEGTTPPPGYVPHAALKEEREKRQARDAENAELKARLAALESRGPDQKAPPAPAKAPAAVEIPENIREEVAAFTKAFPILAGLVASDTPEGGRLRKAIEAYGPEDTNTVALAENYALKMQMAQAERSARQQKAQASEARAKVFIDQCLDQMEEAVPGLFDKDSGVDARLAAAAKDAGIDLEVLVPLTDPRTIIAVPDGKGGATRQYLGSGAVSVVKMLAKLNAASNGAATSGDGKVFTQQDVDKIVAEKVAESLNKIKPTTGKRFTSLGSASGAGGEPPKGGATILSEAELAKLTPKELAAYEREGA